MLQHLDQNWCKTTWKQPAQAIYEPFVGREQFPEWRLNELLKLCVWEKLYFQNCISWSSLDLSSRGASNSKRVDVFQKATLESLPFYYLLLNNIFDFLSWFFNLLFTNILHIGKKSMWGRGRSLLCLYDKKRKWVTWVKRTMDDASLLFLLCKWRISSF